MSYLQTRQDCPGAFFLLSTGSIVTKPWFVEQIRSVLTSFGLPQDDYAGHSFRIGAATTAAQKGLEDSPCGVGKVLRFSNTSALLKNAWHLSQLA